MMQLLCNGVVLDLYADAGLQFTHDNPLFAFDSLKCERTTNFKIPSTPTNDKVLSLARIPAYSGEGMRRKFDAELQAGVVVLTGYLYVSKFDGKDYNAIFVTGELVGLQNIKNLGKISEIMTFADVVTIGATPVSPSAAASTLWQNVKYRKPNADVLIPSISIRKLYEAICTQYNITSQALPSQLDYARIIPAKPNGVDEWQSFVCSKNPNSGDQPSTSTPANPYNLLSFDDRLFTTHDDIDYVTVLNLDQEYLVRSWQCKMPLKLTFPEDWPETLYVYRFDDTLSWEDSFYGDRYFWKEQNAENVQRYGDPLAGRTIELASGDYFVFIDERCFVNSRRQVMGTWTRDYGFFLNEEDYSIFGTFNIKVQSVDATLKNGEMCRLQDNLPNITFVEFAKTCAALCGRVLNYSESQGLTFEKLSIYSFSQNEIDNITKRGEVMRTFGDFAQSNIVKFKSNDSVRNSISIDYTIDNENLSEEKVLQEMPFSEGDELDGALYIEGDNDTPTIGGGSDGEYLVQIELPKNEYLQVICEESTQIKIDAHMNLLQYNDINTKTMLLCEGLIYIWTSRSWQKDIAKFTLAKVGQLSSIPTPFSIEATVALENSFSNAQWNIIREYGFDNPSIVPVINSYAPEDPRIACSLIPTLGITRGLKGDGTSYIDTLFSPTSGRAFEITYNSIFVKTPNRQLEGWNGYYWWGIGANTQSFGVDGGGVSFAENVVNEIKITYSGSGYNYLTLNGISAGTTIFVRNNYHAFHINGWPVSDCMRDTRTNITILDNGVKVRDMYPFVRNGENGMIDIVNGVFYSNDGSGSFSITEQRIHQ